MAQYLVSNKYTYVEVNANNPTQAKSEAISRGLKGPFKVKKKSIKNPAKLVKSATGWIKATAVKIANGKLYIKRPKK